MNFDLQLMNIKNIYFFIRICKELSVPLTCKYYTDFTSISKADYMKNK
jgi:hypothetical protein